MINVSHYGDKPPEGSIGEMIYDRLDNACYPWENFWVTRSTFGGWNIKFYCAMYNEQFHQNVMLSDEMIEHLQMNLDEMIVRVLHDLRLYITKYALEHQYKRKEGKA